MPKKAWLMLREFTSASETSRNLGLAFFCMHDIMVPFPMLSFQHLQELNTKSETHSSSSSSQPSKPTDWISPQTCDQCGLVLKSLSILQYHMKAIHSTYSDREHKCEHDGCSKAFITSSQLRL